MLITHPNKLASFTLCENMYIFIGIQLLFIVKSDTPKTNKDFSYLEYFMKIDTFPLKTHLILMPDYRLADVFVTK